MATKRVLFDDYPQIGDNEPMIKTSFYKWLLTNKVDVFTDALKEYLAPFGFDIKKHILSSKQVEWHRYTFENRWYRDHKFDDLYKKNTIDK